MQVQITNPGLSLWPRIFFAVVALVLITGVALLFVPELVIRRWPWALTPFNTRFLGAFYVAELAVVLVQLRVNRWSPGRLSLPMALAFTGLISLVSLLHLGQFDFQRRAVWTWFIVYLGSALISALFLWQYRRWPIPAVAWPTPSSLRIYLQAEAVLLGLYGVGLLLVPAVFSAFWPWKLDDFHGQLYSAIFTTGALGIWLLSRRAAAVEYLAMGLGQTVQGLFAILGLIVVDTAVHKIDWTGPGTWAWIGLFGLISASGLFKIRLALALRLPATARSMVVTSSLLLMAFGGPQQVVSEPVVISGAGDITAVVEEYRQVLGGQNNGGEPGSFGSGYREINWDTLPDEEAAPNPYAPDFFNQPTAPRARGIVLATPGEGLFVSADSDNPSGALPRFGNINLAYADSFKTFSEERLFSPVGSNIVDATFYVPGTNIPAGVRGFGAVYTDVDTDHTAFEYFDINGNSLGKFATPIADSGLSFLGVAFPEPIVHRVRIAYGTTALGPDDSPETDVAVMDNFIFGEPQAVPIQTQIGADNNFAGNPFVQPQDPALAGGGIDQSLAYGDVLFGTPLSDLLIGGLGVDVLLGDTGEDVLIGGLEHFNPVKSDRKFGGDGNDILIWGVGDGSDLLDGGPGEDVLILGLVGEVENGQTVFRLSENEQTGQVFVDPSTQLPVVDVTNAPGFCGVVDAGHTADSAQQLQALNLDHLVRFFLREQADSFKSGVQTADNGLRQTMHLRDIEFLVCPSRDGGAIEALDLTTSPPTPTELNALALNQRLQLIVR